MRSARPTLVSSSIAIFSASSLLRLSTFCCASMTFFLTDRCGNKLNCWNTIPRCVRTLLRSTPLAQTSTPSTTIEPLVGCSRRLMQRSIVDLPEPEGPRTTTTSPLCTSRSISRRTTLSPKAFWRFLMLTTTSFELLVSLMIGPPYRPAMWSAGVATTCPALLAGRFFLVSAVPRSLASRPLTKRASGRVMTR